MPIRTRRTKPERDLASVISFPLYPSSIALQRVLTMPQIPLELTDCIIDFLHKDARALASCAIVCRAWTPAARFHLFRSIVLQDHTFTSSFQRLLRLSPDLGHYVRELTIAKFVTASDVSSASYRTSAR
ncbi:hypothetical protein NUW54_g14341 [Trametes sanguinea]|uniref:Uncharacterized protein n=1 Tax=Trametes sanguinea TaxID=158606 RepID=A0ACC1MDQ4_9APHY|nr:hypothetical protein NUW54_g14341 [Trametes sanguinea]